MRRANLSLVLTRVHTSGTTTRAALTRSTGLNRSTIGALVGELSRLGLVSESEPETTSQVGRPSLVIRPGDRAVVLAVNPEVDAVTLAVVGLGGAVLKRVRYDTRRAPDPEEVVTIVSALVAGMGDELRASRVVVGVGVAVPGLVRERDGLVDLAPHLGWSEVPLARLLSDALALPVRVANDAAAGALGEGRFGVGAGARELVYLNGGASGIGGGVIARGALLGGLDGFAGEIGHTFVGGQMLPCHCGAIGCLETEVTRAALLELLDLPTERVVELDARLAARLAGGAGGPDGGASRLRALLDRQLDHLAVAVRNCINVFDPELVVLGGFLGSLYSADPKRLERAVARSSIRSGRENARMLRSSLGDDILLIGAAELAFAAVLADPAGYADRL
ncbi:ROK family protein [Herbiconiux sp. 11R-BC]|uniref:ROK family protein n=1 Tax=Herbiconiux sp. 11R-BC TaxID=3111637 RepID=UPI003C114AC2